MADAASAAAATAMPAPSFDHSYNQSHANSAEADGHRNNPSASISMSGQFDIFEWHPAYQSCQKYFLDHAQHENSVQAVAALININLPFQWSSDPVFSFAATSSRAQSPSVQFNAYARQTLSPSSPRRSATNNWVSLIPFIRRLIITGFDREAVLHGFFGDDWRKGIGPLQECERRNYLFAAKSGGWAKVKHQYDMSPRETVPFMQPPQNIKNEEIEAAEKSWSQWLALEDWMVGPRAPEQMEDYTRDDQRSSMH